ncbi:MAG: class I SAM-dependent methyltransferase [Lentisphaerota bacterium]
MLFLSSGEQAQWRKLGVAAGEGRLRLHDADGEIRKNLLPVFRFYIGALKASHGDIPAAREWFNLGALEEDREMMSNAFIAGFLERQNGRFELPEVVFADPRPFVHFTTVPMIHSARAQFIRTAGHSLPVFRHPLRIMDIGCGNGALVADLLRHLREIEKIGDIGEILLIDFSQGMMDLAVKTVGQHFPASIIKTLVHRVEEVSGRLDGHYDIALSSLAYHHMPWEKKLAHLRNLCPHIDHFLLFELGGNHDTPEVGAPELAVSVFQSYGRLIDAIFAHDAPVEVAQSCVDRFILAEEVSLLKQPRGQRTEYHMLRSQWHDLFRQGLVGGGFTCWSDTTAYSDQALDLYTLHYGR